MTTLLAPQVSIVLASFNRAKLLPACIESVLTQTFTDWELLVVDDGSEDNTFEVVDPYLREYSNIRYLPQSHQGQCLTKNAGIWASKGRHVTFIDSDDLYKPSHLECRIKIMRADSSIDLMQGGFKTEGEVWVIDYFDNTKRINLKECAVGATFFGKREVFLDLQGFQDLRYGEDTDFWVRAEKKFKTLSIQTPETYLYRRGEDSLSTLFERELLAVRKSHQDH